ncbi:hypothetical protein H4R34_001273 [Dimargaris verticillata]|uniref:C2 NT-type domain-containing protein n=1 Tax=Dimargaris verticillata TaxID=2761393 RepID=A0A9W8EDY1_9FUNG|nr:hypothetical protein H4R34_001273 [Dimargaris verticillata]
MQALYHWFISKHRLVGFEVQVTLHELINIPLVSGNFYVKWRIKNGSSSTGYTDRAPISEHRVQWDQHATKNAELVIGKDGVLSPCELHLWVKQEMNQESPRNLGTLIVNLAEYARQGEVSTRYLLQECKSNSTIKMTIHMKQISGDTRYKTPTLKKAQIPSAIANFSPKGYASDRTKARKKSMYDGPTQVNLRPYSFAKSVSSPFLPLANGNGISPYEEPSLDIMNEIFFPSQKQGQNAHT